MIMFTMVCTSVFCKGPYILVTIKSQSSIDRGTMIKRQKVQKVVELLASDQCMPYLYEEPATKTCIGTHDHERYGRRSPRFWSMHVRIDF